MVPRKNIAQRCTGTGTRRSRRFVKKKNKKEKILKGAKRQVTFRSIYIEEKRERK